MHSCNNDRFCRLVAESASHHKNYDVRNNDVMGKNKFDDSITGIIRNEFHPSVSNTDSY